MASNTIAAGELSKKVIFKQPTETVNNEGGREITYSADTIETWARVDRFNQFRGTEAMVTALVGSLDFYVRYSSERAGITKDWLIEYRGEDYVIHQIELIEQKEFFLRFTAKSRGTANVSANSATPV